MASFTVGKVGPTEGPLVVVATCTTLNPRSCKVHRGRRCCNLASAGHPCLDRMAATALQSAASAMLRMIEILGKRRRPIRIPARTPRLVARAARPDVFSTALGLRPVALVAGVVCSKARRDGQRNTSPRRLVAGRASCLPNMPAVIEPCGEAFQARKPLHCPRLGVRMTYRADRVAAICELLGMTARARKMSREFRSGRLVVTLVAKCAGHSRMSRVAVLKSRKVLRLNAFRLPNQDLFRLSVVGRARNKRRRKQNGPDEQSDQLVKSDSFGSLSFHHLAAAIALRCDSGIAFFPNTT